MYPFAFSAHAAKWLLLLGFPGNEKSSLCTRLPLDGKGALYAAPASAKPLIMSHIHCWPQKHITRTLVQRHPPKDDHPLLEQRAILQA
jgi:hypothetical protein